MFQYVISAMHQNVTMGPGRRIIPGVTMAEHMCSSFFIKNDNSYDVCSPVNSLRGIRANIILCRSHFIISVFAVYKPKYMSFLNRNDRYRLRFCRL